jgi:hypothetical protein
MPALDRELEANPAAGYPQRPGPRPRGRPPRARERPAAAAALDQMEVLDQVKALDRGKAPAGEKPPAELGRIHLRVPHRNTKIRFDARNSPRPHCGERIDMRRYRGTKKEPPGVRAPDGSNAMTDPCLWPVHYVRNLLHQRNRPG